MKTYYALLGLDLTAGADDIKRAFRREIARYHPDKVQHLGPEFQEIASTRAAELTEAYRVLMDDEARREYDQELAGPVAPSRPAVPRPAAQEPSSAEPAAREAAPRRPSAEQASTTDVVRRAVLARIKEAAGRVGGSVVPDRAFDALVQIKGRRGLFRSSEADVRIAARVVSQVDAAAVTDAWMAATRMPSSDETLCLMLLGADVAPARDLGAAVSELRRRTRRTPPLVIPVDLRDWEPLLPPETPPSVRNLLTHLRQGH